MSSEFNGETIAAISTPAGEGAVALVRVSGAKAVAIAEKIFRGKTSPRLFDSHTQHLGEIAENGQAIDQVLLAVHRSPASYTGEDLVEISCHGGGLVTTKVLEMCLRAGARAARPGEFTERAYLNEKLDLTQAEAVIDLIRAQTDLALRSAGEQLAGRLGEQFRALRQGIVELLAQVDAAIDFPEEGIAPNDSQTIAGRLDLTGQKISELLATARAGQILREGLRLVIFGATNAGKSSLFNRLLGFDRAITSEMQGTTRDTIEEAINLRGIAVRLIDTAGMRPPENAVEHEGIERTQRSLETADLRLHVTDSSRPRPKEFSAEAQELVVLNKSDLKENADWKELGGIRISCKTGAGLQVLEDEIFRRIGGARLNLEHPLAINTRHAQQLRQAQAAIVRARAAIKNKSTPEMFAIDLRDALDALDELLGDSDSEAVRNAIFSQFCIGK